MALIENKKRTYLFIQNLGPGSIFVQFGQSAAAGLCAKFVIQQTYEPNAAGLKGTLCPIRNLTKSCWFAETRTSISDGSTTCIKGVPGRN